jgi:hypothetical protein
MFSQGGKVLIKFVRFGLILVRFWYGFGKSCKVWYGFGKIWFFEVMVRFGMVW